MSYRVLATYGSSLLAHAADINDLLEGLDGVLKDGLDGLHDTEAALHIVDLGLHALDGLHLAGDLDEGLAVIESLDDERDGAREHADVRLECLALVGDETVLNIGADETAKKGVCSLESTFSLEHALAAHVHDVLGRDVQGWEELLFSAGGSAAADPALPNGTIVAAWSRHRAADVVAKGFRAIESHNKFFYLCVS